MSSATSTTARIDFSKLSVMFSQLGGEYADVERHLGILGIRTLRACADYDKVCRSIERDKPDLVLCGMRPGQQEAHTLMRGIRHQDVGTNPFSVLISIADPMSPSESAQAINTGLDSLLVAPFDRDSFVRRVTDLAYNRKKLSPRPAISGQRAAFRPGSRSAPARSSTSPTRYMPPGPACRARNCGAGSPTPRKA